MSGESSDDEDFGYEDLEFGIGDNNVVDSEGPGSEGVGLEEDREGAVEEGAAVVENEKEKADMQKSPYVPEIGPKNVGPHPKLSRGEEQYSLQKEMKYVKERKFMFSRFVSRVVCRLLLGTWMPGSPQSEPSLFGGHSSC